VRSQLLDEYVAITGYAWAADLAGDGSTFTSILFNNDSVIRCTGSELVTWSDLD
jgi:hypothetical protein